MILLDAYFLHSSIWLAQATPLPDPFYLPSLLWQIGLFCFIVLAVIRGIQIVLRRRRQTVSSSDTNLSAASREPPDESSEEPPT